MYVAVEDWGRLSQKGKLHPALRAALALSGLGQLGVRRNLLRPAEATRVRKLLLEGTAGASEILSLHQALQAYPEELGQFGVTPQQIPATGARPTHFDPDDSADRVWIQSGIYGGKSLRWMAENARAYLYRLATGRYDTDPVVAAAALQALLGVPITQVPPGWDQKPARTLAELAEAPIEPREKARPEADPVPITKVHASPRDPAYKLRREGDRLKVAFPWRESLINLCRSYHDAAWDGEQKEWDLPLEAAVRLVEDPSVRACAPEMLDELASRYRPIIEARQNLADALLQTRMAPAADILGARPKRYVIRSQRRPGHVLARFERNEDIGNMLFQRVEGRYNKQEGGYLFPEVDLVVVAKALWKLEFVFEDALIDSLKEAKRAIQEGIRKAFEFTHPLKGADDAELEYVGANGLKPYGYQRADIRYAIDCIEQVGGVGLFLDMGLGKTASSTAVYDLLRRKRPGLRALVFCPRSAFSAWRREMGGMLPGKFFFSRKKTGSQGRAALEEALRPAVEDREAVGVILNGSKQARAEALALGPDIVIINYDSARTTADELRDWVRSAGPVLVICDESHRIKDPTTQTTQVVLSLCDERQIFDEGARIALSGTPISQGAHEFFTQAAFIDGGLARSRFWKSYRAFCERYFFIDRGPKDKNWFRVKDLLSGAARNEYMQMLAFATVRRKSEEAQDLPEMTYRLLEAQYEGGIEAQAYQLLADIKKREIAEMDDSDVGEIDPARLFMRMRQLASHPANIVAAYREAQASLAAAEPKIAPLREQLEALLAEGRNETDPEVQSVRARIASIKIKNDDLLALPQEIIDGIVKFVEEGKRPVKLDLLLDFVEDVLADENEKVIICCDFDETEKAIVEALKDYEPIWFKSLTDEERIAAEEAFQTDPKKRVLIAKAVTISEGLTLTAARHTVLYDAACGFSTKTWEQVQKRMHRDGQTRKCTLTHLVVAGTIDIYGLSRVINRAKEASRLLQDTVSSFPDDLQAMLKAGKGFTDKRAMMRLIGAMGGRDN